MWVFSKGTGPKWNKFRASRLNTSIYYLTREKKNLMKENIVVNEIKRKIGSNYLYMNYKVASWICCLLFVASSGLVEKYCFDSRLMAV